MASGDDGRDDADPTSSGSPRHVDEGDAALIDRICRTLRDAVGHDFSGYKKSTLLRRIERRMAATGTDSLHGYHEYLRQTAGEPRELLHGLAIGVTRFFRDPEAFEALATRIVGPLVKETGEGDALRVWVPGCATGEEAYGLAMLFAEALERQGVSREILIFATDIDEEALNTARRGRYPASVAEDVSPARLDRYFSEIDGAFQIDPGLRDMCLFSNHDLLRDPPFSRLDLISCRNLLIYLEPEVQKHILELLHYALRDGGYLFVGPSESVSDDPRLFGLVDDRHRLFVREEADSLVPARPVHPRSRPQRPAHRSTRERPRNRRTARDPLTSRFERALLEEYGPDAVVVDDEGAVVHSSGRADRYLRLPAGTTNLRAVDMAGPELQLELRASLHEARESRQVVAQPVEIDIDGRTERIELIVRPLEEGYWLVVFEEPRTLATEPSDPPPAGGPTVRRLEKELNTTRRRLDAAMRGLEQTNLELQSGNEELLSMNEELQASNEELQSSKEELQSVNEELETVNAELSRKVSELDEVNADLQNLFANSELATLFLDRNQRIKRFTPATRELLRLIDTDVGRHVGDINTRMLDLELAHEVERSSESTKPRVLETTTDDGRSFRVRISPYETVDGVIDGLVVTFVDVTDLVRAHELDARLANIVSSSHDAIIGKRLDGTITSWNEGAERMYGWSADEAIGKQISLIIPPEHHDELRDIMGRLARGERVESLETTRVAKDGTRKRISLMVSPLRDPSGTIVGASAIARDITERQQAMEDAEKTRELLQLIIDAVPALVSYVDNNGVYQLVNLAYERWFGTSRERIRGRTLDEVLGDAAEQVAPHVAQALDGSPVSYELQLAYKHGGSRWVRAEYVPDVASDGKVRGFVALVQDIDAQKSFEHELSEASRRKNEFLAMLAHELRNPLSAVVNGVDVLRNGDDADRAEAHRVVERQLRHLGRLVDDLLDVSRITMGKIALQLEQLDARDAIGDAVAAAKPAFARRSQTLQLDLPDREVPVYADRDRLVQIVGNLLSNASRYSPNGSPISVSASSDGSQTLVTVADRGEGISPQTLPNIFDLFTQGERGLARESGGLGVGLTTVARLVELHGGSVHAESPGPGSGATFRVRLPSRPLDLVEAVEDQASRPTSAKHEAPPRRVLLVEDNEDAAQMLQLMLERWGHAVTVCPDGESAFGAVDRVRPDLILLDIGLPTIDGYEVARRLRQRPDGDTLSIVALSGYGREEDKAKASESGFDAHLTKPASREALRGILAAPPRPGG